MDSPLDNSGSCVPDLVDLVLPVTPNPALFPIFCFFAGTDSLELAAAGRTGVEILRFTDFRFGGMTAEWGETRCIRIDKNDQE
jgi:hypothetical protein